MNKSTRGSTSSDEHPMKVKQEFENEDDIDEKKPFVLLSPVVPCTLAVKCEYSPYCGCPQCRFNANPKVKSEEQEIKQEIKLKDNKVKIETELTRKCVKDKFEDGECGCNDCIGVVGSTQSSQKQPQVNSPVQEQNEQSLSTDPIDNQDSSDYINDCPTPDYLPPFFSEDDDEEDDDDDEDSDENTELESDNENTSKERSSESNSDEEKEDGTRIVQKKERPFKCDHCKRAFLCKQDLKDHQAKVHQIGKCYQYKCKWYKCKYFMNDRRNAVQHIVRAHFKKGDQRDPIDFLHKIAITKKSMIKPDRRKLTITLSLNCPKCPDHFPNKEQLNIHLLRSHQIKQYRCVVRGCSASFNNKSLFYAHKKEVHRNVNVWQCDHCAFETMTYEYLQVHTIYHHEEGHFRCAVPGCSFFSFTNRSEMGNHHQANHRARKGKSCYKTGLQMFSSDWCSDETQSDCQAAEDEQKDKNNYSNSLQSSQNVIISKRKYHEVFSESDNDSDVEPSDDDEEYDEEFAETDSEIGGNFSAENKKSKKLKLHANESCLNDDTCDEAVKVSRKKYNQELKIITEHLNCWKCDGTSTDIAALNKHLRKRHQIRSNRCLVRDCLSSFNSTAKLYRHYLSKHGECGASLPCWKCEAKTLTDHRQLYTHTWKMHQQGHFKCSHEGCPFETYSTRSVVINHYKIEHSDKSTFACPFKGCGMTFPFQYKLTAHSTVHKKEKSFKCEHCEAIYSTSDLLKRHLAIEHQIGKMIQYKCEWAKCGSIFNYMQAAYLHIRKWHFKEGEKRHPKEFVCKVESTGANMNQVTKRGKANKTIVILRLNCPVNRCSKHFPCKDKLNIHLSECHKIEKFRCVVRGCSASFQNCFQFTAHKNEAHGKIKVWHCDQCKFKSDTFSRLSVHKTLAHEEGHFACGDDGCKFVSRKNRYEVVKHRMRENRKSKKI